MILKEDEPPSRADEDNLVALMKASATSIATSRPEKLLPLTGEIELAALDSLIDHYEEMLGANLGESKWQAFFKPNVVFAKPGLWFSCHHCEFSSVSRRPHMVWVR